MDEKIYCLCCMFLAELKDDKYRCDYWDNYRVTWLSDKDGGINHPSVINKNNDCKWYVDRFKHRENLED